MTAPLLKTKLFVPGTRPRTVSRPRLVQRLNSVFDNKLTLLSAPAGFGKTTLLSEWLQQIDCPVAWLSLDSDDNDPIRFWRYVSAALASAGSIDDSVSQSALGSIQTPSLEGFLAGLLNNLAVVTEPIVMVLDDLQSINGENIFSTLNYWLDNVPPSIHLIIATREDPPLALHRRRALMELYELRAADLRFTLGETTELLNKVQELVLKTEDLASLAQRTEGWAVGLQMAALSLQALSPADRHYFIAQFAGDDRYVVDYLMEEVFRRQPPDIQIFLLQTCFLERLCSDLCQAVTGRPDCQEVLSYLEQSNLFTEPLDNTRFWFRYHRLFADLLRQRLGQRSDKEYIATLYRKASDWHEGDRLIHNAVSLSQAAGDPEHTAALLKRNVLEVFYRSETNLVFQWLDALPKSTLRQHPLLCAVYANTLALNRVEDPAALELAEQWLAEAQIMLDNTQVLPDRDTVQAFVATFRAYLARFQADPPHQVAKLSRRALDTLPAGDTRFRSALNYNLGAALLALGRDREAAHAFEQARQVGLACKDLLNSAAAIHALAEMARRRGELRAAAGVCRKGLESLLVLAGRPVPYMGPVLLVLGQILLEWNQLEEADSILQQGVALGQMTTVGMALADGFLAQARLCAARGDISGAMKQLDQAEQSWGSIGPVAIAQRTRLQISQPAIDPQQLQSAAQWATAQTLGQGNDYYAHRFDFELTRVLITLHRAGQAVDLESVLAWLEGKSAQALQQELVGQTVEAMVLQALAEQELGRTGRAVAVLCQALTIAQPEGYVRFFVDEGQVMAEMLEISLSTYPDLLADTVAYIYSLQQAFNNLAQPTLTLLSPREIEVVQLIAVGLNNSEIAQKLVISVNTVKKHIGNIFQKLQVESRTRAIAQARQQKLVK